jgi:hypothetical protein
VHDWGVPDWRDAGQYPRHSTGDGWSWEFLRRNPKYRAFWTEHVLPFVGADGSIGDDENGYSAGFGEAVKSFGLLAGPHDPRRPATWLPRVENSFREIFASKNNVERRVELYRHEVAYVSDLRRPLEPQFERTLRAAKGTQAFREQTGEVKVEAARLRVDKYVLYLRLIDAEDGGVASKQIEDELFGDIPDVYLDNRKSSTFKNTRRAAHRLRDRGYRALAANQAAPRG